MMAAEEASLKGGFFERILKFYERWVRRALEHPVWLGGFLRDPDRRFLPLLHPPRQRSASRHGRRRLRSRLRHAAGQFAAGNQPRDLPRRAIVRAVPEVESTSRRTGLQLGLAAVTEPNTGDIAVKLKDKRSRGIDEIISEVRAKVKTQEPALDVDFTQVLQDMIGDLTGAPQPVVVKLFSPDADLLATWAPRVADALGRIYVNGKKPVVDIEDGIENTTSGPAVVFNVNPPAAAKAGFTTDQIITAASALVDGEPATTPVIINDRPYTLRVRYPPANRASLEAMSNTLLVNSTGGTATLGSMATVTELPGPDRNPSRKSAARRGSHRAPGRLGPGQRRRRGAESRERLEIASVDPRGIRRHLQGAAEVVPRSHRGAVAGPGADFPGAAVRVPFASRRRWRFFLPRCFPPPASSSRS